MEKFADRYEAGKILAKQLKDYANKSNVIVLALPRGGVPVAYEIARELKAPLDVFIVRKLGVPGYEELAMGAIASGGTMVFNEDLLLQMEIPEVVIQEVITSEKHELLRREKKYRKGQPFPELEKKIVILVDDGIATGATMRAAISALRLQKPEKIVVAVPVSPRDTIEEIKALTDEFVCPLKPDLFYGVGAWYFDFAQTEDAEVRELLTSVNSD